MSPTQARIVVDGERAVEGGTVALKGAWALVVEHRKGTLVVGRVG